MLRSAIAYVKKRYRLCDKTLRGGTKNDNAWSIIERMGMVVSVLILRLSAFKRRSVWREILSAQEGFGGNPGLFEDCSKCPFRHITRVVGDSGVKLACGVVPDFMRPGSLSIKLKSQLP